jgi:maleylacetate reductase
MIRIVRFGAGSLAELGEVLDELGATRAVLVASRRGARHAPALPVVGCYDGVRAHVPVETVREAATFVEGLAADCLVGLGGGSAVDTCKAAVAELAGRGSAVPRIVAVPTTYAGAEWTPFFGVLVEPGRKDGGSDGRALPVAAVYDPELTLGLPLADTVGTAMNALAHSAEALYHPRANPEASAHAERGAELIGRNLEQLAADLGSLELRTRVLEGAMHAAIALGDSGLCLGHALAQALGGRFGLPQGAMNAVCLPAALRFNQPVAGEAIARFAHALGVEDAALRVRELALLGGFRRLRDAGVPEDELRAVADAAVKRAGARANPRPVTAEGALALLRSIW